jgi:hypothetical protein
MGFRRLLMLGLVLTPGLARADSWSASECGAAPQQPQYDLSSRAAYNASVQQANAYQQAARDYTACVLKQAHADETAISRQAQDRIADIQTIAVGVQQEIYGRLQTQAALFKAAARKLK